MALADRRGRATLPRMTDCTCNTTAAPGLQTFKLGQLFSESQRAALGVRKRRRDRAARHAVPGARVPAVRVVHRPPRLARSRHPRSLVDDAGRVAGYFYNAGAVPRARARPRARKPSPTFYAAFHQQGVRRRRWLDHARGRHRQRERARQHRTAPVDVASAHYADPDRQLISCCAYDDDHGWIHSRGDGAARDVRRRGPRAQERPLGRTGARCPTHGGMGTASRATVVR